jgi:hypothetical protein
MAEKKKITFFEIMVYVAYAFFILLGGCWLVISFMSSRQFNPEAFTIVAIFGIQAYFHHRLTNLILGILALGFSIFMLLEVISSFDLMAKEAVFDGLVKSLMSLSVCSIIMSCILIFSYIKLSFKDQMF